MLSRECAGGSYAFFGIFFFVLVFAADAFALFFTAANGSGALPPRTALAKRRAFRVQFVLLRVGRAALRAADAFQHRHKRRTGAFDRARRHAHKVRAPVPDHGRIV